MVDPDLKFWNTFFDYVFEWAPVLKQVYSEDLPAELGDVQ